MARSAARKAPEEAPWKAGARILAKLEEGELSPVYVLRGEERYFRERISDAVAKAAATAGLEVCRHDVKHPEFRLARLLDDLEGSALFAAARCVIVQEVGPLTSKGSKAFSSSALELLLARMNHADGGTLVLASESLRADHALVKAARAQGGESVVCRRLWDGPPPRSHDPRDAELVRWLSGQAAASGIQLGPDEAVWLAQVTGNDLFALEQQLERLRERGPAGVRELVDWQAGASPYEVAEAIVLGQLQNAVRGVEALFRGGFEARGGARTVDGDALAKILLNALYGKLREALRGTILMQGGASVEEAAAACGVKKWPKAVASFRARLGARPAADWRKLLDEVAALERRQHTGTRLDAGDFALFALRWRKRSAGRRGASAPRAALGAVHTRRMPR